MSFWESKKGVRTLRIVIIVFLISFFYNFIFTCSMEFDEYSDGWYIVIEEGDIDSWGNSHSHLNKADGPFTESEVQIMLNECKSIYQKLIE